MTCPVQCSTRWTHPQRSKSKLLSPLGRILKLVTELLRQCTIRKNTYRGHVRPAIPGPSYQRRSSRHPQRQMTLLRWVMQVEKATTQSVLDRCRRSMGWASDVFRPEAHPNTLSPRGAASANENISTLKARENTHSSTRASGASSQELSAQLAGETCSVIDVGDCYRV
jgi:hypothetical protein